MNPTTKKYFLDKGIDVEFNTLGCTQELLEAYISSTAPLVREARAQRSEFVKSGCYNLFYPIDPRTKLTGFEGINKQAITFKSKQGENVTSAQVTPCKIIDAIPDYSIDYKETLKNELRSITKPILLYLSGGIDSELVALALLDAKKEFTAVIFHWTHSDGDRINTDDTAYAMAFCQTHNIVPIEQTLDIGSLWASPEFEQLSLDIGVCSAHLVTHAYIAILMATEFPDNKHLFGGEVRYRTNYVKDDKSLANIVLTTKVTPGYDSYSYFIARNSGSGTATVFLNMTYVAGVSATWAITHGPGTWSTSGGPVSGNFASAPFDSIGYEFRVVYTSVAHTTWGVETYEVWEPPYCLQMPPEAATAWAPITTGTQIAEVTAVDYPGQLVQVDAQFTIEIRGIAEAGTPNTSNFLPTAEFNAA